MLVNALFHYVGPSFAILLFPVIGVLGVAWLRIAAAAIAFAPATRPWRVFAAANNEERTSLVLLGISLGAMNCCFYLALSRLPLSLVAAMEFIGPLGITWAGSPSFRNLGVLSAAMFGLYLILDIRWVRDPVGLLWSVLNTTFFVAYILLGHRMSRNGASKGIMRLGTAMLIASIITAPLGIRQASLVFHSPRLLAAGIGVGLASSVVPYVCDQLVMARLSRESFALLTCLFPTSAAVMGAIVLNQMLSLRETLGIALVVLALAIHGMATRHRQEKSAESIVVR